MKIYNEVILSWNEERQQLDTVYEDSYEYDGPVDLLAHTVGEHTNVVHVGAFLSNSGYARNCEDGSGIGYHITDMGCPGNTPAEDYIGCICNRIYPDICVTESTCYLGDLNELSLAKQHINKLLQEPQIKSGEEEEGEETPPEEALPAEEEPEEEPEA